MASSVDICNLALAHIGEDATLTAISPPEGSVYGDQCARFYPIALNYALYNHEWSFTLQRVALAPVTNTRTVWAYAFGMPSDCLRPRRVLPDGADDESRGVPFEIEGTVLYCDDPSPTLVYQRSITNTALLTPPLVVAVSRLLASYLAGSIPKKLDLAEQQLKLFSIEFAAAKGAEAMSHEPKRALDVRKAAWKPSWMAHR